MTDPTHNSHLSPAKEALLERWRQGETRLQNGAQIVPRTPPSTPVPLSMAQERIWFVEQFQPGTPAYNLFFCARSPQPIDPGLLARSLADLAQRHTILQMTVRMHEGEVCLWQNEGMSPDFAVEDFRDVENSAAITGALASIDSAIHAPFSLETGPLARMVLCRMTGGDLLALVVHHLVADGWSLAIALNELSTIYQAHSKAQLPRLKQLPIQYSDFALWQREGEREAAWKKDLTYWSLQLAGVPPVELPADRPRPAVLSPSGNWCEIRLSARLSASLRQVAREEGITLFMVLLGALKILLYKMTAQDDLTVGTAIANRAQAETFGLIGNFINMLALRTSLEGDPTFPQLLKRIQNTCNGAFGHQQAPFERVVQELRPDRDLSRSVLFQAIFILQPPTASLEFDGATLEPIELGLRTTRADLELHLWDRPQVSGRIAYSTDLFNAATMESFRERFENLLEQLVQSRNLRLSECPVLLPWEAAALDEWSRGPEEAVSECRVDRLIEKQAAARDKAIAVRCHDTALSYYELNRRANQLAHHLLALGVKPETRVGICLERSIEMIIAVLAVLKSGGVYVPLDPRYPADRLATTLKHAAAPLVITTTDLAGRLDLPGSLICLDRERIRLAGLKTENPGVFLHSENLAYVIFTSGSTGVPKGVQIAHKSLANLAQAMIARTGLQASDVQVCIASLSFDASVAEIFPPLAAGATLVIATREEINDGERLSKLLLSQGATVLQATATTWLLLQSAGHVANGSFRALCGGEATSRELSENLVRQFESCWHMYGPTETTVWSTSFPMTLEETLSLGPPLSNTRVFVVDADLQQCPIGVTGELCIGGIGLSRGYLGDPGLAADKFMPDHLSGVPGARLYRTGDLVRYTQKGSLEFVGRRDNQIKLRGHRIELGEIEAVLSAHPLVERAVVTMREFKPGDARLVGYLTLKQRDEAGPIYELMSAYLRKRLPDYMVPFSYVVLEEFPQTPTGKVDRLRLPAPDRSRNDFDHEYIAPRTEVEQQLAAMIAEYLEVDRVGVTDDFFAMGGHSLLAARLAVELRGHYGIELMLQHLFLSPTVAQLAMLVEQELTRKCVLESQEERLRRIVADLPATDVDRLLQNLLAGRAQTTQT